MKIKVNPKDYTFSLEENQLKKWIQREDDGLDIEEIKKYFKLAKDLKDKGINEDSLRKYMDLENREDRILSYFEMQDNDKYREMLRAISNEENLTDEIASKNIKKLVKTYENDKAKSIKYEPCSELLSDIIVEEIIFDKETPPTLNCKKVMENYISDCWINLKFDQLYEILSYCGEFGEQITNLVKEKLKEAPTDNPIELNLKNYFGDYLMVDNCYLKVNKSKYKDEENNWVEEEGNFYFLDKILSHHDIDKNNPYVFYGENLPVYLKTSGLAYLHYKELKKITISDSAARERAGLKDDLLFKIAYSVYKISYPPKQILYNEMKEYVFDNIDSLLNRDEDTVVISNEDNISDLDWLDEDTYNVILKAFLKRWAHDFRQSATLNEYKNEVREIIDINGNELNISDSLMKKTIKLILGYLESIGQYGD